MCGIAGIYVRDERVKVNLEAALTTMLDCIDHRGGDATGFLAMTDEGIGEWQRAACDAKDFNFYRRPVPVGTRIILAHTRWATQGLAAFMENNHPIRRGPFYIIHNGHVTNDDEMFLESGRTHYGQVDSEAIAAHFAHHGALSEAGKVMERIEGGAAIAAVDERFPRQLVLARGYDSPLIVLITDKVILWGSTEGTVRQTYKSHIGKLPKRQKIMSVNEGNLLFVNDDGSITWDSFKPYEPKFTYTSAPYRGTQQPASRNLHGLGSPTRNHVPLSEVLDKEKWDIIDGLMEDDQDEIDREMRWSASDILDTQRTTECDECGGKVALMDVIRVPEPDSDFEWKLCEDCCTLWEQAAESFERANRASGGMS